MRRLPLLTHMTFPLLGLWGRGHGSWYFWLFIPHTAVCLVAAVFLFASEPDGDRASLPYL